MMLKFPYGKGFLELDIPEVNLASVVESHSVKAAEDAEGEIVRALNNPIGSGRVEDLVKREDRVALIVSDITRPAPNQLMVPPILEALRKAGLREENLEIIVANGLHRSPSRREMEELLGKRILEEAPLMNHDARDDEELVEAGRTSFRTRVTLNRRVVEADSVIITGLIEPHFFAGYSGGRKSILPGIAGAESIFQNHSFRMIGHPKARYGILKGNPIHEDSVEAARFVKLKFMVNVVLNKERQIMKAFAGDFLRAHEAGVKFLEGLVKVPTPHRADIVVTTNGGYPLDRNLYQAVKGMATGELVVKEGGVIIIMAECIDGVEHMDFQRLMEGAKTPKEVLETIREKEPLGDQWEAQVLARVLQRAEVIVVSKGVKDSIIEDMLMTPASTPEEALNLALRKMGKNAKIVAVPEGPFVIPYVSSCT
ncbi:MAG: nickel-dependent lactate racemase [Candidatus Bathyarchaeia archaeon]